MECNLNVESNELEILIKSIQREVDELVKTTEATLLKHDGKIAELCIYIKENLSNELRLQIDTMISTGELDELINNIVIKELDFIKNSINTLNEEINNIKNNKRKFLFIGDSYAEGYNPDGNVTGWITYLKQMMNLNTSDYTALYRGGLGFGVSNSYTNLINGNVKDETITDVVVAGSYNDYDSSEVKIREGILSFRDKVKELYPNAKLHIAFIGKATNGGVIEKLAVIYKYYKDTCETNDINFLDGCEYALQDTFTFLGSDGIHPTENGQKEIAKVIKIALEKGVVNLYKSYPLMFNQLSGGSQGIHWETILDKGIVYWMSKYAGEFIFNDANPPVLEGKQYCKIADITTGYIVGSNSCHAVATGVPCVVQIADGSYHEISINFIIRNKELLIQSNLVADTHDNYKTYILKKLQVGEFSTSVPALYC